MGVLMSSISCGNDDYPVRTVFTVNTPMINHMVNTTNGEVMGLSNTYNKLTIDTVKHTASLELNYNDGSNKTLSLNDLKATPKRLRFYELTSPTNAQFSGYVDFNQGSMRYSYMTDGGIRVISFTPEVFFNDTRSDVTYDDTTQATTSYVTMYTFDISSSNQSTIIRVADILHAKDLKTFLNITTKDEVPITITPNGFTITGTDLKTIGQYERYVDSTNSPISTTDKYPFKTFNATIDLVNDHLDANFMMGGSATVVATGKTYRDNTLPIH